MLQHPIMIEPEKRVTEAQQIMSENSIYYLPVVADGKRLLGLVTPPRLALAPDQLGSLDMWEIYRYMARVQVKDVMIKGSELITIEPTATLEDAASLMVQRKVGGLPVIDEAGVVIGLITDNHLLVELRQLLGAIEPGWRATVRTPSRPGEVARLTDGVLQRGWRIMALGSVRAPKQPDEWDTVIKVWGCTRAELTGLIESIEGHELRDMRETTLPTN